MTRLSPTGAVPPAQRTFALQTIELDDAPLQRRRVDDAVASGDLATGDLASGEIASDDTAPDDTAPTGGTPTDLDRLDNGPGRNGTVTQSTVTQSTVTQSTAARAAGRAGTECLEGELWVDLTTNPPRLLISGVDHQPLVDSEPPWYERVGVRALDLLIAVPAFVVALPVILLLMIAVRLDSPGPVLFASRRITRDGRFFDMWKLRTMMTNGPEILEAHFRNHPDDAVAFAACMKLENDPRVTSLGRILRRWSLDELPQLLNVILGHMSIVGPRPLLPEEAERMGHAFPTVVRVKGGLTGLWQISGRSTLTFEQRVPLDVEYVNERTLRSDLRILATTVVQLLRGRPGAF